MPKTGFQNNPTQTSWHCRLCCRGPQRIIRYSQRSWMTGTAQDARSWELCKEGTGKYINNREQGRKARDSRPNHHRAIWRGRPRHLHRGFFLPEVWVPLRAQNKKGAQLRTFKGSPNPQDGETKRSRLTSSDLSMASSHSHEAFAPPDAIGTTTANSRPARQSAGHTHSGRSATGPTAHSHCDSFPGNCQQRSFS